MTSGCGRWGVSKGNHKQDVIWNMRGLGEGLFKEGQVSVLFDTSQKWPVHSGGAEVVQQEAEPATHPEVSLKTALVGL